MPRKSTQRCESWWVKSGPEYKQLAAVDVLPFVGRGVGSIAVRLQRMGRRTQTEEVEQQALVVATPAVRDESVFRRPAVRQRGLAVAGPVPVGPLIKLVGQLADFRFLGNVAIEKGGDRQGAREQERRIDGGQFTLPGPAAGFDVQKMIEEPFVASRIRLRSLRTFHQISQSPANDLHGEFPDDHAALDHDRNCRQRHPDRGDAGRGIRLRLVADQSVVGIGDLQIVQQRRELQPTQVPIRRQPVEVGIG